MKADQFDRLIGQAMGDHPGLSDLLFTPGKLTQASVDGHLHDVSNNFRGPFSAADTREMAVTLLGDSTRLWKDLTEKGYCDLAYQSSASLRFRVNVYTARAGISVAMRLLPQRVPTVDELALPPIFKAIAKEREGLVLVTGGTGMGKTTSLAAILAEINATNPVHIITLEDPIEYVHPHHAAVVSQRELGVDFMTYADGLRAALRQTPRIIVVGELRDRETVDVALQAGETGHLVLGALHSPDAAGTLQRLLGFFDPKEERQVRGRLAESLKYCVAQRLLQRIGGGRVGAFEVLRTSLRTREILRDGESEGKTLTQVMESGGAYGMMTFDTCIAHLFMKGMISEDSAMGAASDRFQLHRVIDRIKTSRGERTSKIAALTLDDS